MKQRIAKLPIGTQVVFKKIKANYAEGVRRPRRERPAIQQAAFNAPQFTIVLRKAA